MIPKEKLVEIATALLDKSRAGQVRWRPSSWRPMSRYLIPSPPLRAAEAPTVFTVTFQRSRIYVEYRSPSTDADYVVFEVCGDDDIILGSFAAREGETHWELLRDLHMEASRNALGWDKVVGEITEALKGTHVIGIDSPPPKQVNNFPAGFLDWVAGEWQLKWTPKGGRTNVERLTIHRNGTYDVNGEPKFRLENIKYDPVKNTVRFDKTYLPEDPRYQSGRKVHHTEELRILSDDAMLGNRAGNADHILDYTRLRSPADKT